MSVKKDLYYLVRDSIEKNTKIRHCRLFNSQFDNMGSERAFEFPCAFIEFSEITHVSVQEGAQHSRITIRVHIGSESLDDEHLDIFDLSDEVHLALHGLTMKDENDLDVFSPLDRSMETQDVNHDNVIVWVSEYTTLAIDNSAHRNCKLLLAEINEISFEKEAEKPRLNYIKKT